jgi:hypothetical protein
MQYILDHWQDILTAIGGVYTALTVVATLIHSDTSITWLKWIGDLSRNYGANIPSIIEAIAKIKGSTPTK